MVKKLEQGLAQLEKLNRQRIIWLRLSGFVVISILALFVDWHYVQENRKLEFLVISSGIILSVLWWYWTMIILKNMIEQKKAESDAIIGVIQEIREIKEMVKKFDNTIDNSK